MDSRLNYQSLILLARSVSVYVVTMKTLRVIRLKVVEVEDTKKIQNLDSASLTKNLVLRPKATSIKPIVDIYIFIYVQNTLQESAAFGGGAGILL